MPKTHLGGLKEWFKISPLLSLPSSSAIGAPGRGGPALTHGCPPPAHTAQQLQAGAQAKCPVVKIQVPFSIFQLCSHVLQKTAWGRLGADFDAELPEFMNEPRKTEGGSGVGFKASETLEELKGCSHIATP